MPAPKISNSSATSAATTAASVVKKGAGTFLDKAASAVKNASASAAAQAQRRTNTNNNNSNKTAATKTSTTTSSKAAAAKQAPAKGDDSKKKTNSQNSSTASANGGSNGNHGQKNGNTSTEDDAMMVLLQELQKKLEREMALKAEAENNLRIAKSQMADMKEHALQQQRAHEAAEAAAAEAVAAATSTTTKTDSSSSSSSASNKEQLDEAERNLQMALSRIQSLEQTVAEHESRNTNLQVQLVQARDEKAAQAQELHKIREQRDEQERKEMSLTNRLNAAKKKEAEKVAAAEKLQDRVTRLSADHQTSQQKLEEEVQRVAMLRKELESVRQQARAKIQDLETGLADERKLNDDRKQKMKGFIEKKSEELKLSKADNDSLQAELTQTSKSLMDLNLRWKQLHAQWVQSQTRNRELQRDLNKIKKDSENLHKVGDTLEMKLSRSATETEEHKNKRIAAKNELMTVLRTLETEREALSRLKDSIKFTFTPKALSQQQLLNESVDDFEAQLVKLARRLGRPLPPPVDTDGSENANETWDDVGAVDPDDDGDGTATRSAVLEEGQRLIGKLDRETQGVSKCIMSLVGGIERLQVVLDASGERTCYSVLSDLIATGPGGSTSASEETRSMTTSMNRLTSSSTTARDYHH